MCDAMLSRGTMHEDKAFVSGWTFPLRSIYFYYYTKESRGEKKNIAIVFHFGVLLNIHKTDNY